MRENTIELLKDLKTVTIVFDRTSTHSEVLNQFLEKMVKEKFAPREEIIEHMKMIELLSTN